MSMSERKNSIIRMARESGFHVGDQFVSAASEADLQRFADFVIADDRKEQKMKTVEVSQSALESLQKMVEQLQGERDDAVKTIFAIKSLYSGGQFDLTDSPKSFMVHVKRLCDECTAKPEVLE